jgi:predicted nucleic acid-binding protein
VKWLLDTNVLSEHVRPRPSKPVLDWIARRAPEQIAASTVTIAELRVGISATSNDKRRRELNEWFEAEVVGRFGGNTLPVTVEVLIDWLELSQKLATIGQSRAPADLLIAATARVHDLIVVSRNARDFAGTGVILYDPWTGETHDMDAS